MCAQPFFHERKAVHNLLLSTAGAQLRSVVMRGCIGFLLFFFLWGGLALAGELEPTGDSNPYASSVSAESISDIAEVAKRLRQFIDAYDRRMEYAAAASLPTTHFVLGMHSMMSAEAFVAGRSIDLWGGAIAAGLAGTALVLKMGAYPISPSDSHKQVLSKFSVLPEGIAEHQRQTGGQVLPCRASFLALVNPFRRSRILTRWVPAWVGVGAIMGIAEMNGGSNITPTVKKTFGELPKLFKKP